MFCNGFIRYILDEAKFKEGQKSGKGQRYLLRKPQLLPTFISVKADYKSSVQIYNLHLLVRPGFKNKIKNEMDFMVYQRKDREQLQSSHKPSHKTKGEKAFFKKKSEIYSMHIKWVCK